MRPLKWNKGVMSGLAVGVLLLLLSALHASSNPLIFLNVVGFMIVAGGLVAAGLIMYPLPQIRLLFKSLHYCLLSDRGSAAFTVENFIRLAEMQNKDPLFATKDLSWVRSQTIKNGLGLISTGLKAEDLRKQLEVMCDQKWESEMQHATFLLTLAKLGPGFGLLGTLFGLVVMLQDMGQNGNFERVGPSLAISLLATLYGVLFANLIFQPFAELIQFRADQEQKRDKLIIDGVVLLKEKKHPLRIRDSLSSYLNLSDLKLLQAELNAKNEDHNQVKERAA